MSITLGFLQEHLFPFLPASQKEAWPKSLCKPLNTAILHRLLIPSLPSALGSLPPFLELVKQATYFEDKFIVDILGNAPNDREIKVWADGVGGHYERKRRMEILDRARAVIIGPEDGGTFLAEAAHEDGAAEIIPVQGEDPVVENGEEDTAWGLDGDEGHKVEGEVEEDGWGFDDDDTPDPVPEPKVVPAEQEDDPADAWGWNDEESVPLDDDPWAEELEEPARPPAAPSIPKTASRLEKFSSKGKTSQTNGVSQASSPVPVITPSTARSSDKRPPQITVTAPPKETFLVSGRTKDVIRLVEDVLNEGEEFTSSNLFSSTSAPGALIQQSALSILDLYRALYPVTFGSHLTLSTELEMRFSNDCLYMSGATVEIESAHAKLDLSLKDKLQNSKNNLKLLGDSWHEDAVVSFHTRNDIYCS